MTAGYPRPELTAREKWCLGRLVGAYTAASGALHLAPADPARETFEALTKRGGWVEKTEDGGYKVTNYGMSAFYNGRVVRG